MKIIAGCLSAPLSVCFAVTGKCNLRCRHCGAKDMMRDDTDLPAEKIFDIIDQLGKAKVFDVAIFGGEPLVRGDLFRIIEKFREYPFKLSMNTNAMLMSHETADTLINKYGIKSYVVSIDGARKAHEKQRGKNTFDRAISGARNILKNRGSVVLSFTVTKINIGDIVKVTEIGRELGVDKVRFNHVFYGGNAACYIEDVFVSPREEETALKIVGDLSRKYPGYITGSYIGQIDKFKQIGEMKPEEIVTVPPCGAATTRCAIRSDGWVTPCEIIMNVKAGDVTKKSFLNIWKNSKIMRSFRKPMQVDMKEMPECVSCDYQFICFWGHRCYPYFYPGGIENKELYCWKRET